MTTIYIVFGIFCVVAYGVGFYYMKVRSDNKKVFLAEHPDAARILAQQVTFAIKQKTLRICLVDGQTPVSFMSGMRSGVLLHRVSISLRLLFRHNVPAYFTGPYTPPTILARLKLK